MKTKYDENLVIKSGEGFILKDVPGEEEKEKNNEIELVNKFTKRHFEESEIYIFSLILCDNEIDRDFERFSDEALEKLSILFVGKTGITDHNLKSGNQIARIFKCYVQTFNDKFNSLNMPYKRLYARAYIPRSKSNSDTILNLDSGIKKEISIHCAVKNNICSICGKKIKECDHLKSNVYNSKCCHVILDCPTDAYEWSFVVVPSQKNAGVIKHCDVESNAKIKKDSDNEKFYAQIGKIYEEDTLKKVNKYIFLTENKSMSKFYEKIVRKFTFEELEEYKNLLENKINKFNFSPQLARTKLVNKTDDTTYKI
ncbi:MAG: hypothetical protein CfP315_0835 [Candidatus Improbicoccus pseudotrichonymphae]|uniref:Uncharacterized protein n=1 Tax=Candidatus Improbicoccus pseudotrichonymphae TaxID=3033792 RepID=A0AA48IH53_9FIRM|nr:MAG: hypothetical protein CfP315_0835 [Candidatus Improbicoccus pseudotrichonymphae]